MVKSPGFEFCELNQCLFCLVKDGKNLQFRGFKTLGSSWTRHQLGLVRSGSGMHLLFFICLFFSKDSTGQLFVLPKDCLLQDLELRVC